MFHMKMNWIKITENLTKEKVIKYKNVEIVWQEVH